VWCDKKGCCGWLPYAPLVPAPYAASQPFARGNLELASQLFDTASMLWNDLFYVVLAGLRGAAGCDVDRVLKDMV
jgi:hypothetical protein